MNPDEVLLNVMKARDTMPTQTPPAEPINGSYKHLPNAEIDSQEIMKEQVPPDNIREILNTIYGDDTLAGKNSNNLKAEAQINSLIQAECNKARIDESKLYKEWFNSDITEHIDFFIERRLNELHQLKIEGDK